jgi:peptidoglycan/xylan/chitin deacetylase (PgdA/CDA1 family)
MAAFSARVRGRYQRATASLLYRRPFAIKTETPIISFTFDDFPRSAWLAGGTILERYGATGTYYASFSLMGQAATSDTSEMFLLEDATALLERGHELGCHTFGHCDAWKTDPIAFKRSINENRSALATLIPGAGFKTFSYPINLPRMRTKRDAGLQFIGCRCGGQTINAGSADLNLLSAYFLEKTRDTPDAALRLIAENQRAKGWLIFATHDVSTSPTQWGCAPDFFERIVRAAAESGARILPVDRALEALGAPQIGVALS